MKSFSSLTFVLSLSLLVSAQSGRRGLPTTVPASPPAEAIPAPATTPRDSSPKVTVGPNQNYRCSERGGLASLIETTEVTPKFFSVRELDARATLTSTPQPVYSKEARRNRVQGFVILKALLSAEARVDRIRIVKRLPAGLTENAIRAACKIKFKPAMKNGRAVAQQLTVEYVFRLAHSSIFAP